MMLSVKSGYRWQYFQLAVTTQTHRDPARCQAPQYGRQRRRQSAQTARQCARQHILRLRDGTAAVLSRRITPPQCTAGPSSSPRKHHTQRTGLPHATDAASVTACARRHFDGGLYMDMDDVLGVRHVKPAMYRDLPCALQFAIERHA